MTKREAKQIACARSAIALATCLAEGWLLECPEVEEAVEELIEELRRRGRMAKNIGVLGIGS